ncbi:MAG: flagellar hook-basal body complex protein, partial [Rhodospirillales bacterium]
NPAGLLTSTGARAVRHEVSFTVQKKATAHRDSFQFTFGTAVDFTDGQTITINGIVYEVDTGGGVAGTNKQVITPSVGAGGANVLTAADLNTFLSNLEAAIEANDPEFATTTVRIRRANDTAEPTPSTNTNTLILDTLSKGSYNVLFSTNFTNTAKEPDGTATYTNGVNFAVNKEQALKFDSDGLPSKFNVAELQVDGFANGAADMDDDSNNAPRISLDFGTVDEANGLTQFGGSFTPVFITQDGSQFGTFAGVTINAAGLMTALFDNGETRPVFQIPVATFVNVNSLGARSGNVWNSTEASGDPTLRDADNGPAGQVVQASLEQSTVDIGTEFTKMIVVQRAFSAAAKIISTADEMLEELIRTKR